MQLVTKSSLCGWISSGVLLTWFGYIAVEFVSDQVADSSLTRHPAVVLLMGGFSMFAGVFRLIRRNAWAEWFVQEDRHRLQRWIEGPGRVNDVLYSRSERERTIEAWLGGCVWIIAGSLLIVCRFPD